MGDLEARPAGVGPMTRAELVAELVEITTWRRTYDTNEGADRVREITDELKERTR